jgi:hypothetical protein
LLLKISQSKKEFFKNIEADFLNPNGSEDTGIVLLAYIRRDYDFKSQTDVLKNVSENLKKDIKIYLLDEKSVNTLDRLNIGGSPTLILFNGGVEKGRFLGKADNKTLAVFISKNLC